MLRLSCIALFVTSACGSLAIAQEVKLSPVPTQAVYEYQLNYQLPWQRWYGGPGLSLGGTMPTKGVFGYSSLNGMPFPGPLGAGVYVNGPAPHGVGMPGPFPFGSGPMVSPGVPTPNLAMMGGMASPNMAMMGMGNGPPNPMPSAGFQPPPAQQVQTRRKSVQTSTPGAKRMSVEQQNLGDAKLRQQQWGAAYVNYRNATDLAPERPEPHFRLGVAFTALKQYASAIREFKRSLELDPTLPQSGDKLPTIFGADSKIVQSVILPGVAQWTREELADTDRLFLLGLMLYFDDDPRGNEILEAALRSAGPADHILAFMNSANEQPEAATQPGRQITSPFQKQGNTAPISDDSLPPSPIPFDAAPSGPFPDPPPT